MVVKFSSKKSGEKFVEKGSIVKNDWKKITLPLIFSLGFFSVFGLVEEIQAQTNNTNTNSKSTRSTRNTRSTRSKSTDGTGANAADKNRSSSSSRDRLRDRKSKATGTAAAGKSPTPDPNKKTVEGKKPADKGAGSKAGGKRPLTNVEFKMQVDQNTNIMYLESLGSQPSLNIQSVQGDKFVTRLTVYNPRQSAFDELSAVIKYDPSVLKPVGVDDSTIESQLKSPAKTQIDSNRGLLLYEARLKEETRGTFNAIAKIEWECLRPSPGSYLRFINNGQLTSGVFNQEGLNILHMREDGQVESSENAGLLDAMVAVSPSEETNELLNADQTDFSSVILASNIAEGTAIGKMRLELRPRTESVSVGVPFLVDVVYSNPSQAEFDSVNLSIKFDSTVFEVLDSDEGNWITRGVNIFDGDYHLDLPFDYQRKNLALNTAGLIQYEMGFQTKTLVPETGTIATIKMVAKRPVDKSRISFNIENSNDDTKTTKGSTSISFLGLNLIGVPEHRTQYAPPLDLSVSGVVAGAQ